MIQCLLDQGLTPQQIERYGLDGVAPDELDGALTQAKVDITLRKRNARLAEIRLQQAVGQVQAFMQRNPKANYKAAINAILSRDALDRSGGLAVENIAMGIRAQAFSNLDEAAELLQPRRLGTKHNIEMEDDLYRELHGVDTGNAAARDIAKRVSAINESLRQRKNAAGAAISKMEGWGLPQRHVAEKVRKAGVDAWKEFVLPRLNREKMLNKAGVQMSDNELDEVLDYVFETITTEGANKNKPPKALRNSYAEYKPLQAAHRVLHFKDGEAGLQYQKSFGDSRTWQSVISHLEIESRQIAAMEVLGPNPKAALDRMTKWARVEDSKKRRSIGQVLMPEPEAIWQNLMGFEDAPASRLAEMGGSVRSLLSSAQLGGAAPASIPDAMTVALNAHYNGLKMGQVLKRIDSLSSKDMRAVATRTGHIADWAIDQVATAGRFEDITGSQKMRGLSDINYRIQGMTGWTNGWQMAFHLEFTHELQRALNVSGGDYNKLPKGMKRFVDNYGLREYLPEMAKAEPVVNQGDSYFNAIGMSDNKAISHVLGAIESERNMAILMPTAANRAMLNRGKAPGTLEGEILRSAAMYKTYPVSLMMSIWGRYLFSSQLSAQSRMGYAASMFIGMTMLGGMAYQLKEMAKGKDAVDTSTPDFWVRAVAYGGSLSLIADLLLDGQTRHGQGMLGYALGPAGGLISDVGGGAASPVWNLMLGRDVDVAEEYGKLGERASYYIPLQSVWWARHAFQRNVRDFTLDKLDPGYEGRQRIKERRLQKRTGQKYYWKRGETLPGRAPEMANAPEQAPMF